ncbi:hypothetical protein [Allopontixanthobacter sediminis]|nr:hypothetical protein [Allopontixanthobacter sediminis]
MTEGGHDVTSSEAMGSAKLIIFEGGFFIGGDVPRRPGALAVEP